VISGPSHFAEAFRTHVLPSLCAAVNLHALLIELDEETFTVAHSAVMREAIERGACYLPPDHLDMLDDWIGTRLLDEAVNHAVRLAPQRKIAANVWRDILQWDATLCLMLDMGALTYGQ
jgi:hypothetical protein